MIHCQLLKSNLPVATTEFAQSFFLLVENRRKSSFIAPETAHQPGANDCALDIKANGLPKLPLSDSLNTSTMWFIVFIRHRVFQAIDPCAPEN